jgi:hypothetical protein
LRLAYENDYPAKIKSLVDDLKLARDKIKDYEERYRVSEKISKANQETVVRKEEMCRDLKSQLKGSKHHDSPSTIETV